MVKDRHQLSLSREEKSLLIMSSLYSILKYPSTSLKCEKLEQCFREFDIKDLHQFLPHLLANIFGYDQSVGWELRWVNSGHTDFLCLRTFLGPKGKLFQLLSRLDSKNYLFNFPVAMLPHSVQASLQKKEFTNESFIPVSASDYYLYHFSSALSIQQGPRPNTNGAMQESLYTVLFEDYLNYYLPFHGTIPLSPKYPGQGGKRLLSERFSPELEDAPDTISVSESFVEIFLSSWITHQQKEDDIFQVSQFLYKPSDETLLLLRRLIKHIHFFVNGESATTQSNFEAIHTSEELRRTIISNRVRKRLYVFLESCLKYCTCDSGYRYICDLKTILVVVELWLTYIQPWRYTDPSMPPASKDKMEHSSSKWYYFITENFPFYSVLFVIFLGRCQSLDLTTQLPALLLYRVTKVFSRGNLYLTLNYAESLLMNTAITKKRHFSEDSLMFSPNFIRASLIECCGPEYCYGQVFHEKRIQEVNKFLLKIMKSKEKLQLIHKALHQKSEPPPQSITGSHSFIDKFTTYFSATDQKVKNETDDIPLLDAATKQLQQIFELPDISLEEIDDRYDSSLPYMKESTGDSVWSPDQSKEMDLLGRFSGASNKLSVEYKGDTFTQPFRSYENPTLVRMLCRMSVYINENYISNTDPQGFLYKFISLILDKPYGNSATARINLRPLASYYNLLLIFIVLLLAKVLGISNIFTIFILLLTLFLCIVFQTKRS